MLFPMIPVQHSVKNNLILTFSIFAATNHKVHFRKVLTWILRFGCFSWCHTYIFENNTFKFPMQNLMLNWLAPIWNSKNAYTRLHSSSDSSVFLDEPLVSLKHKLRDTKYKIDTKTLFLMRRISHKITIVKPNIFYIIHDT